MTHTEPPTAQREASKPTISDINCPAYASLRKVNAAVLQLENFVFIDTSTNSKLRGNINE
jgi:hypothetical protein